MWLPALPTAADTQGSTACATAPSVHLRHFGRLGLGKRPLHSRAGGCAASSSPPCSLAPIPAIESQTSGDPHLHPHRRAIPTRCRVVPVGEPDGAGRGSRPVGASSSPYTSLCTGPRTTSGRRGVIPTSTRGWHWPVPGLHRAWGKWDFTSFTEDAVNAVLGLLVAFLHLLPFQLGLLFLAFPKLAPQDAADGAYFGGSAEL